MLVVVDAGEREVVDVWSCEVIDINGGLILRTVNAISGNHGAGHWILGGEKGMRRSLHILFCLQTLLHPLASIA